MNLPPSTEEDFEKGYVYELHIPTYYSFTVIRSENGLDKKEILASIDNADIDNVVELYLDCQPYRTVFEDISYALKNEKEKISFLGMVEEVEF